MATKKKMLQAAAGQAGAGGAALDITDVFSTYLYDGTSRPNPIENGINLGQSFGSGSARFDGVVSDYLISSSAVTLSGDFTIEAWVWFEYYFEQQNQILGSDYAGTGGVNNQVYIQNADRYLGFYDGSSAFLSSSSVPNSGWSHIAITRSGSTCKFYINGNASGTFTSSASVQFQAVGSLPGTGEFFEGYMNDVRIVDGSVVYTGNFTPPTTPLTAITNTALLVCQGSDPFVDNSANGYTITNNGNVSATTFGPFDAAEAGEGGLVWVKSRSHATAHILSDTERGTNNFLSTNDTDAAGGSSTVNSFNSNGFTVGSSGDINEGGGYTYASWTFRKAPKFFTCVTYTGTGDTTTQTISHNLGAVPGCIIVKRTDSPDSWRVYHRGVDVNGDGQPWTDMLTLNTTAAASDFPVWGDTAPTSTEFTVGYESSVNASGGSYVAYLFAHNDGDGEFGPDGDQDIIKCGSFTTDGSGNATIDLGFEPQFVINKTSSSADSWTIADSMRGFNAIGDQRLYANLTNAEATATTYRTTSTGFTVNGGETSKDFIYMAIRRGPLAQPESATEVFAVDGENTSEPYYTSGFTVDMGLRKRQGSTGPWGVMDRLRQGKKLASDSTNAEVAETDAMFDYMDGMYAAAAYGQDASYGWMWKRAPGFFDAVAYTGDGVAGRTVSHNLGVAPEMIWVKNRSGSSNWQVYHKNLNGGTSPANYWLKLNDIDAEAALSNKWNDTEPTQSVFSVGNSSTCNESAADYIAYLFASLPGISKVGSFTSDGTDLTIDCGFSSGARFVLIKDYSAIGAWFMWDTERGIVAGNDSRLRLNDTSAEDTASDNIDPHSSGFIINSNIAGTGKTFLFYAIA